MFVANTPIGLGWIPPVGWRTPPITVAPYKPPVVSEVATGQFRPASAGVGAGVLGFLTSPVGLAIAGFGLFLMFGMGKRRR